MKNHHVSWSNEVPFFVDRPIKTAACISKVTRLKGATKVLETQPASGRETQQGAAGQKRAMQLDDDDTSGRSVSYIYIYKQLSRSLKLIYIYIYMQKVVNINI